MKKYINIIFSLVLSLTLVLTTSCGKKSSSKETGFIVDTSEAKLIYKLGEDLDLSGLKVKAAYGVGEYKELTTQDYTLDFGDYNKDVVGSYTFTVSYKKFTPKTFNVEVEKIDQEPLGTMPKSYVYLDRIKMTSIYSVEYRIDNEPYLGKVEFTGLEKGSTHTIYARIKETEAYLASPEISQQITLLSGPAEANLKLSNEVILVNQWQEFIVDVTPNDDINTPVYAKVITPDITNAKVEYYAGNEWIELEEGNVLSYNNFKLTQQTFKFRIKHNVEANTKISLKLYKTADNSLVVASNEKLINFILGPATTKVIYSEDYAIVDEAYYFQVKIDLNNDTHLIDEFPVYGQIIYNVSQVPNDGFTVEFYDKNKEAWVKASKNTLFQFNTEGMYLDNATYDFRFTPLGQSYEDFTFFIDFKLVRNQQTEISTGITINILELNEAKKATITKLQSLVNLNDYEGDIKTEVESKYNEALTSINTATSGTALKEIITSFQSYIESLNN